MARKAMKVAAWAAAVRVELGERAATVEGVLATSTDLTAEQQSALRRRLTKLVDLYDVAGCLADDAERLADVGF